MRLPSLLHACLLLSAASCTWAGSGWGFTDATVSVQRKDADAAGGIKEKLSEKRALSKVLKLGDGDTLKVTLTTQEDRSAKRPHQAFLLLKDPDSGLDISYSLNVKESGKAKMELMQKDLPVQFLHSSKPIDVSFVIASFGPVKGYNNPAFQIAIERDMNAPLPSSRAVRYEKLDEIHHIFKPDPTSPPVVVSLVFVAAVLAALPALAGVWVYLGVNIDHLSAALKASPVSHILFVGSIVVLEGIFFMYYTSWNLLQTLPAALAVGVVAFLSGSRALGEVQDRRLAGFR